jgi:hypothetical protein
MISNTEIIRRRHAPLHVPSGPDRPFELSEITVIRLTPYSSFPNLEIEKFNSTIA